LKLIQLHFVIKEHHSSCSCRYSEDDVFLLLGWFLLLLSEAPTGSLLEMYSPLSVSFGNMPAHKLVCWCEEGVNVMAEEGVNIMVENRF